MVSHSPHAVHMRLSAALLSAALLQGCSGDTFRADGGTLELNDTLRADLGASTGMAPGDFFADGVCPPGSTSNSECQLITPVLPSLFSSLNRQFTNRLRKADFLWVASEGIPRLSYEYVGRNVNIVSPDDPTQVFATGITVGTCHAFPLRDPVSRNTVPALEDVEFDNLDDYVQQFDVMVRACAEPTIDTGVSTSLAAVETGCVDVSVASLYGNNPPPAPQNSPFCVLSRGVGSLLGDVSFSVMPAATPGHTLSGLWPNIDDTPRTLLPHLKTVPVGDVRTISRRAMRADAGAPNDDGSTTFRYTFNVGDSGNKWRENFSPNVFVTKVRVRKGPVGSGNFMTLDRLESGRTVCGTRNPDNTEYDIPMCQPGTGRFFRTTPAYHFDTLVQGSVGDPERLTWTAFVRIPAGENALSELAMELDLTAESPTSTLGSGLMAAPASLDLGPQRNGQQSSPPQSFLVSNYGVASLWVRAVDTVGTNAVEFGPPLLYRVDAAGAPAGAPFAAPFIVRGGSRFAIGLQPHFLSIGAKQSEVVVSFTDARNRSQNIRMPVVAQSVSPSIHLQPEHLVFNAVPGAGRFGAAVSRRAALLTNDGPVTFQRTGFSLSGAAASQFRILAVEYGPSLVDPSQPQTLGAGEAEIYRLGFYPAQTGESEAFLTVHTTEGDVRMQLHGWCEQACEQPPELSADAPSALPPATTVETVYPRFKIKWWPFGTKKTTRDREDDR